MSAEAVRTAFLLQAKYCSDLGSPFTAALCRAIGKNLDRSTAVGATILDWHGQPDASGDSVPLRLAGGLHALARRNPSAALASIYPPHEIPSDDAIWAAVGAALRAEERELLRWLDLPPQTNEPARSAALMAGLLVIASETRLPVALYEIGASAGLNLVPDRYFHRLGETTAGSAGSRVVLQPSWRGNSPPRTEVTVARRRGVDLAPLDVGASRDRERLVSNVWPDQRERLARAVAAAEIAASNPPIIDRRDAADWGEDVIFFEPERGIVRVLMHTIAFQYFPPASQTRVRAHAARVGAHATWGAPFAWLSFEADPTSGEALLRLVLWPDGRERILAAGDAHARAFRWLA